MNVQTGISAGKEAGDAYGLGDARGLGDAIAGFTHLTGIDQLAKTYEEITGKSCGCEERQRKLNLLFPLAPTS